MSIFNIDKSPERKSARIRAAFIGPAGSGKTFSAIRFARGLVGNDGIVGVVDTENDSATLYSGNKGLVLTEKQPKGFWHVKFPPPWSVPRYVAAINEMAAAGCDVVIIDQISALWEGDGGLLDTLETVTQASKTKDSFAAWKKVTPLYQDFVNAIMLAPIHVIVCIRAKVAYEVQKDKDGKNKPVKIGLKPIQREGFDYEMTLVWNVWKDGNERGADIDKDRTSLFADRIGTVITEQDGKLLADWLLSGAAPISGDEAKALLPKGTSLAEKQSLASATPRPAQQPGEEFLTNAQRKVLIEAGQAKGLTSEEILNEASAACGFEVVGTGDIPLSKYKAVMARFDVVLEDGDVAMKSQKEEPAKSKREAKPRPPKRSKAKADEAGA